jgi:hypothetical protein
LTNSAMWTAIQSISSSDVVGVAVWLPLLALVGLAIWGAATDQPDMVEEFRDMQHYANLVMKDQRKHATITALENGAYCKNEALSAISYAPWEARFENVARSVQKPRCSYCGTQTQGRTNCQNCGAPA